MSKTTKKHSDATWSAKAEATGWSEKNLGLLGGSGADSTRFETRSRNVGRLAEAVMLRLEQQKVGMEPPPAQIRQAAQAGITGPGGSMPHLEAIQKSFGHHDVSAVRAHVGGAAAQATSQMGAEAYATGNDVAFKSAPSLHTAAHEAAHVVQQRSGKVQLKGGVGQVGDIYEQHADQVADLVVQGKSAAPLLDRFTGGAGHCSVQMKEDDPEANAAPQGDKAPSGNAATDKPEADSTRADTTDTTGGKPNEPIDPAVKAKVMAAARRLKGYRVQLVPTDDPKNPCVQVVDYIDGSSTGTMGVQEFLSKADALASAESDAADCEDRAEASNEPEDSDCKMPTQYKGYGLRVTGDKDSDNPLVVLVHPTSGAYSEPVRMKELSSKFEQLKAELEYLNGGIEEEGKEPEDDRIDPNVRRQVMTAAEGIKGYRVQLIATEDPKEPQVVVTNYLDGSRSAPMSVEEFMANTEALGKDESDAAECEDRAEASNEPEDSSCDGTAKTFRGYGLRIKSGLEEENPLVILVHPVSGVYSKPLRMKQLETNFDAVKSELDYVSACLEKGEQIPEDTHFTYVEYSIEYEDNKSLAKATVRYDIKPIEGVVKALVPGIGWVNITLSLNANVLISSNGPIDLNNTFRPLANDIAQDVKSKFGKVQLRVSQDKMSINIAPANPFDIALRFEAGAKGWACTGTSGNHKLNLPQIEAGDLNVTGAIWAQVKVSQDWTQSQAPGLLGAYAAARAADAAVDSVEKWLTRQDPTQVKYWILGGTGLVLAGIAITPIVVAAAPEVIAAGATGAAKAADLLSGGVPVPAPAF